MKLIGNLLWFIFCGLWQALAWSLVGILWSITIVGIPVGIQCFKIAQLYLFPFGKKVVYGGGTGSFLLNIIWLLFGGIPLAISNLTNGLMLCVTIVGIPFGIQCFKLAKLSFFPFGTVIRG